MPQKEGSKKSSKKTALRLDRLTAKDLNSASKALFDAVQKGNISKVATALSPDFNFIDERGTVFLMANCVASIQSMVGNPPPDFEKLNLGPLDTKLKVNSFKVAEVNTRTVGNTVIQTMLYTDIVTANRLRAREKSTFNRSFRWTNVWVEQNGAFQLALAQLTPVQ